MGRPKKLRVDPVRYLEAIEKRIRAMSGVRKVKIGPWPRQQKAVVEVAYYPARDGHHSADPVLAEGVDELRREFSSAFPEWGIETRWSQYVPVRVVPVSGVRIEGGFLMYSLTCGHEVKGERIRVKRVCDRCSDQAWDTLRAQPEE